MSDLDHIRELEQVAMGERPARDDLVLESWLRCLNDYQLDPAQRCEAYIVPETQLREHRQQSEDLIHIARSGIEDLYRQVGGQDYVVLLSDQHGVTVEFLGDPLFNNKLRKAGLFLGSEWSEERAGTCAVGACLATGETLTIHQTDHFDTTHTRLSCTAAPIYNSVGELAAVLDISLLSSPVAKNSQSLARHLVEASARRIELANLMAKSPHEWVLRFARSPDFLDVDPEAAIAIDGSGKITGMTHSGARLLASECTMPWQDSRLLPGRAISEFLDLDINELPRLTRARPTVDRLVRTRSGHGYFVHAIEPQPKTVRNTVARAPIPAALQQLAGEDEHMSRLLYRASRLAETDVGILIQGETGTGKEFLARAIHDSSRRQGRFMAINCAAIPEHLIESELFGHLAGAFTGASPRGRKGLIEEADGGTLFLDEIGDMPLELQSRLLRVLSEKQIQPVGSTRVRQVDIRVIAATHRSLAEQVDRGEFRSDLLYRINAATLTLPSLRDRRDFGWLVRVMLRRHTHVSPGEQSLTLTPAALLALESHDWPGNLRELDNVIAVASALTDNADIDVPDLPEALQPTGRHRHSEASGTASAVNPQRDALLTALLANDWNVSAVARSLHVNRSTVHRQMKRFALARRR